MKKIFAVALAVVVSLSACNSAPEPQADDNYVGVCMNDEQERVDDTYCSNSPEYVDNNGSSMSGFIWGYLIANALMPNYGGNVTNYVTRVDDTRHNVYRGGVPRSGGYVDFNTYKPLSSKTTALPKNTVKSSSYNDRYNKAPNAKVSTTNKSGTKSSNNQYKKSNGGSTYKAPKSSGGGGFKSGGRR